MEARSILLRFTLVLFLIHPVQAKPLVVVTMYPIGALVDELTGGAVEVYSITPKGVRVHTYIVTSEDIDAVEGSDAFIAIGAEEFLSQLPVPSDALIIEDKAQEYQVRINASRGPHGIRYYTKDLESIVRMISDYLTEKFPRLNETISAHASEYINAIHEFESKVSEFDKGEAIASFPLIAYLMLSYNVTVVGPIMPGAKMVDVKKPIISFEESIGTPIDDTIRGLADKLGVPIIYVSVFSDDPLTVIIKSAPIIIGASVSEIYVPKPSTSGTNYLDILLISALIAALVYLAIRDLNACRIRKRKSS